MEDQEGLLHSLGLHVDALMRAHTERSEQCRLSARRGGSEVKGPLGVAEAKTAAVAAASELRRTQGRVAELEGMLEEGRRADVAAKQV